MTIERLADRLAQTGADDTASREHERASPKDIAGADMSTRSGEFRMNPLIVQLLDIPKRDNRCAVCSGLVD